ncbi:hypothetical protein AU253_20110 [Yersinia pestis]|nr:hypothetical protein AU253_20110 [Yersinia pestis]
MTPCQKRGVFAVRETQKLHVVLITPCPKRGVFAVRETQKLCVVMMTPCQNVGFCCARNTEIARCKIAPCWVMVLIEGGNIIGD